MSGSVASPSLVGPARLENVLRSDLFAPRGEHRLDAIAVDNASAVWLGVGLCGERLSLGLPVDVLGMLAAQEMLRRALVLPRSLVLIADSNALAVGHDRSRVERVARRTEDTLEQVADELGFPFECVRGSEIAPWSEAVRWAQHDEDPYLCHQRIQMDVMRELGATLKVGWSMSNARRDEVAFDTRYEGLRPGTMAFAYVVCGRALDHRRPRRCPYVVAHPHERVLLRGGENIARKLAEADSASIREVAGYRRLLRKIGRGIAMLRGERPPRRPEELVQQLLDRLAHGAPEGREAELERRSEDA